MLILAVFWSVKVYSVTVYAVSFAQFYDAVRNSIDTHLTDGYKIWILFSAVMCCTYCHITLSVGSAPESRGWRRVLLCALSAAEKCEVCRQCTRTLIEPNYICCEIGKHPQNTKQGLWLWNRNRIRKPLSLMKPDQNQGVGGMVELSNGLRETVHGEGHY